MKFTPRPAAAFTAKTDGNAAAFDNSTQYGETFSWSFDDNSKSSDVNP
jgi:hypothetical protein